MKADRTLVEDVIRDEVRKILSSTPAEQDTNTSDLVEVPVNDLPAKIREDIGIGSNQSGLADDITPSMIQTGEAVEPNEALEGSVLDPLTNTLLGGLIKGAEVAPAVRRSMIGNKVKSAGLKAAKNPEDVASTVKNLGEIGRQQQTGIGIGLDSAEKLFGSSSLGSAAKTVKNAFNKLVDPVTAPISEGAAVRYKARAIRKLIDKGIPQKEANTIVDDLLKELVIDKPFNRTTQTGRLLNDPIIKQSVKGAAAQQLFGE